MVNTTSTLSVIAMGYIISYRSTCKIRHITPDNLSVSVLWDDGLKDFSEQRTAEQHDDDINV